jgi:uncharacterized protein YuzB (UPF0349 family)
MTIRAITIYRVDCNSCSRPLIHRGFSEFASKTAAADAINEQNWLVLEDGKKHHCRTCRGAIFAAMDATARGINAALAAAKERRAAR